MKPYGTLRTQAQIAGVTMCAIAVQAGISESTMMRWLREPERPERKTILFTSLQQLIKAEGPECKTILSAALQEIIAERGEENV